MLLFCTVYLLLHFGLCQVELPNRGPNAFRYQAEVGKWKSQQNRDQQEEFFNSLRDLKASRLRDRQAKLFWNRLGDWFAGKLTTR